jgi:hypothetical protein
MRLNAGWRTVQAGTERLRGEVEGEVSMKAIVTGRWSEEE